MEKELKNCIECGLSFVPFSGRQIYCARKCKDRAKARKYRLERQLQGLCPQCGRPMDYPVRIGPGKASGTKIKHCSRCREYFREVGERRHSSKEGSKKISEK